MAAQHKHKTSAAILMVFLELTKQLLSPVVIGKAGSCKKRSKEWLIVKVEKVDIVEKVEAAVSDKG
ncbi:MAG: hypothetical protein IPO07_00850 [Haliscomenobacter sp.]|nr:hypothetical protein [Haliscomenobacter sp.]MBK9487480.1 hypothetical protein [Haliscomenobacter sp.]